MSQPINPPRRVYVDPATGADTNRGTNAAPVASMPTAVSRLSKWGGTIYLKASESAPYATGAFSVNSAAPITIQPWGSDTWHMTATGGGFAIRTIGTGLLTLRNGNIVTTGTAAVRCGDTGSTAGRLHAFDTYAEGGECGFQTAGVWTEFDAHRCTGKGGTNDGFNIHGDPGVNAAANLYDCVGSNCGDEGASPHDDTVLNIYGGEFRDNANAGMTAVNNAECNIYRSLTTGQPAEFTGNGAAGGEGYAGVCYYPDSFGVIDGAVMTGNDGPGLRLNTAGVVTLTDYTSSGNAEPDVP